MPDAADAFAARSTLATEHGAVGLFRLDALEHAGLTTLAALPYSIRILLEAILRNTDGKAVTAEHVRTLAGWSPTCDTAREIPFSPARVILQDFTGVPALVDLAAMRSAMQRLGGDPAKINPQIPADLVIDHSVQVDHFGSPQALALNAKIEFSRNRERYEFLRWGQNAFAGFRVVPPATGIVHQVNLEHLAQVVLRRDVDGGPIAMPDTLVGTDSHTTMINGLGVVGWGVGGIEAEAAMLGQPLYMLVPEVVGVRLTGRLREGATATDLVLRVTEMLRSHGVVGKFVEFFGDGLDVLSLPDRATIANMAPEYGATIGFFPVDQQTLNYLRLTGRPAGVVDLVERYCKEQQLFRTPTSADPQYTETLELDLASVEPSLAGPKRPQDRVALSAMKEQFRTALRAPVKQRGFELDKEALKRAAVIELAETEHELRHGAVVIAAITSCTNTSNPSVMVAAGLVAQKAVARGLRVKPWVKTSLAPGSRVVTDYLEKAGLTESLNQLGFHTVGYGCTTCIGNSGPLPDAVRAGVQQADLVAASVLSGNRNFEGRVNPHVKANYLASPPLVVAYALAGTVDIDLTKEPLGVGADGAPVFLKDVWPTTAEVAAAVEGCVTPKMFKQRYADVFEGDEAWRAIEADAAPTYEWKTDSTYIQEPPFFVNFAGDPSRIEPLRGARCLVMVGDSVTTDHISPAGAISADSPAGHYLQKNGATPEDFNSYGSRRGNDRIMTRGTFANVRLRNLLAPGMEGGWTTNFVTSQQTTIYDAAMEYKAARIPLVVLAGKDYGMGSSRDWAAKGVLLLGVKAVIAESFERIHRTNLVCMGVLPLEFAAGQTRESLGLTGWEIFDIPDLTDAVKPRQTLTVFAKHPDTGRETQFETTCRIDTPIEVDYYRHGGVLHMVLRSMLNK